MAAEADDFRTWLSARLRSLNVDETVFVDYLVGILETESGDDRKQVLNEFIESSFEEVESASDMCDEILKKWSVAEEASLAQLNTESKAHPSCEDVIKDIMSKQKAAALQPTDAPTVLDKDKVLAAYSHISDDDELYEDENESSSASKTKKGTAGNFGITKNTNSSAVDEEVRKKREVSKQLADEKRLKDKLNRDGQKKKKQERQEKEKQRTQKGERKR